MTHVRTLPRGVAAALVGAMTVALLPLTAAHADRALVCQNAPANVFADVAPGATHAANIDCIAAYGIAVGVGGGNYDPGGRVSRGQMASFLVNFHEVAVDVPQPTPVAASRFTDIGGTTHADNIRIADQLDITSGRTATTYAPSEQVTRGQMATFVAQALRAAGAELPSAAPDRFSDDDGSTHETNIDALAAAGVVSGIGEDRYDPDGHVTRAQMATFLANAAGLLSEQERWLAPALPVDGPTVQLVLPANGSSNTIEIRWDQAVTATTAVGADFVVADADNAAVVATGTTVTAPADDVLRVQLDASLAAMGVYWLRIGEGAVTDAEGHPHAGDPIAFTFSVPVTEVDEAPRVTRVETDPAGDRLVLTFDAAVTCPTAAGGVAAWAFTNTSSVASAEGTPDAVEQTGAPSNECSLAYDVDGVGDADHGLLAYTQPASTSDQVRNVSGTPLASVAGLNVIDTVSPTVVGLIANAGSSIIAVEFSEPIACSSVATSEFAAAIAGTAVGINSFVCPAPASDAVTLTLAQPVNSGETVSITIDAASSLTDQSLDARITSGTTSVTLP